MESVLCSADLISKMQTCLPAPVNTCTLALGWGLSLSCGVSQGHLGQVLLATRTCSNFSMLITSLWVDHLIFEMVPQPTLPDMAGSPHPAGIFPRTGGLGEAQLAIFSLPVI